MFKNLKMRNKILLPVTLIGVLVFAGIMVMVQQSVRENSITEARLLSQEISARYANLIKADLDKAIGATKALGAALKAERAQASPSRERATALLLRVLEEFPNMFGAWSAWDVNAFDGLDAAHVNVDDLHEQSGRFLPYFIRGADGIERTHTTTPTSASREEENKWYWHPLETKKLYLTEPTVYEVAGKDRMMISVCVPLYEHGLGVAGMDLSLDNLQALAARIQVFGSGYGFLLSESGMIVAHPQKDFIGKNIVDFIEPAFSQDVRHALEGGKSFDFVQTSQANDLSMLYCMTPITLEGVDGAWSFVIALPQEKIFENARNMRQMLFGLSVLGVCFLIAAVFGIAKLIVAPLGQIMDAAQAVAKGDLDRPITLYQRDEIGVLAEALRGMVDALKAKIDMANAKTREAEELALQAQEAMKQAEEERERASRARAEGLAQAGARLERIMDVIVEASGHMTERTDVMLRGTDEQAGRIQGTATSMEEMNATVLEIARNASQAAEAGQQAQGKARDGAEVVGHAQKIMAEAVREADVLKQNMGALGAQAQGIGAIIGVINDIADQTNLLALNAAIEAARAGDAGRGFAVVADEVRKLAEKTMQATKEVSDSIGAIQRAAEQNIAAMESAFGRINDANRFSSQSGAVLQDIVAQSETSAEQIRGIATAAEEQSAASDEINQAIEDINRITQETSQGVRQVAESVSGLAGQIADLNAIVQELKSSGNDV